MKLSLKYILFLLALLLFSGCRLQNILNSIGSNDYSYSYNKVLVSKGTTLYLGNSSSLYSHPYSLETIDVITGSRTIVAGTGVQGSLDGMGTAATLYSLYDMVLKQGTPDLLYIGEGCSLRKVDTSNWQVSTVAGIVGTCSDTDGTGTASARFNGAYALALSGNNLYIGTYTKIRKMDLTTLAVTTVAGVTSTGYLDGAGASAQFSSIRSLIIIGTKMYILDASNNRIRAIDLGTNVVSTIAGSGSAAFADGNGTSASFSLSIGNAKMTTDGVKYLFITDSGNCAIRKVDITTNDVTTILRGSPQTCIDNDGNIGASDVMSYYPSGITFTPYGLFFANDWGVRVIK